MSRNYGPLLAELRDLELRDNELQDSGVRALSAGLEDPHYKLQTLGLSGCRVTQTGCDSLASALCSNPSHLRELDLRYNHPGDSGVRALSAAKPDTLTLLVDHGGENRTKPGPRKYGCQLTLDPNTANSGLSLSEGNRKDMLVLLFLEGPFTRGIFRRCGSVKACREMRERLNAGADLTPLTCESIFVTAAVFKDFLRHIPGSLLSQDLYEQWVGLMGLAGEREEDKVQAVQRLVELLPKENQLLLRHVLAVLHCIQRHAHHNQMNSFNLSVCIAPSMLWGPIPCSPDVESQGTKKVSEVVRFMIEHCRGVLGDDVTSLFGGFPQKSSDHISDVSSVQLNDSSYDSLENELNDEAESPFQDLQSSVSPFQDLPGRHSPFQDLRGTASPFQDLRGGKGKQENQSRDSVITLSDCDLDQPDPDPTTPPVHLQLPPLLHPLLHPRTSVHQPHPQPPAHRGTSEQDALSHRAARWLRRRSEPAIRYPLSGLAPNLGRHGISVRKTSYDGVMGDSEESLQQDGPTGPGGSEGDGEVERNRHGSQDVLRRKHKLPSPLRLDVSCSSLSSPTTSPSGSSMSSLDSAFSQCSTDCADLSTTIPTLANPTNTAPSAPGSSSPRYPAPSSPRSPVVTFPLSHGAVPSPREHCEWSQQKIAHGLHPNTWLKRDRRLSLRQQDKSAWEEEDPQELGGGPNNRPLPSIGDRKVHGIGDPSKKRPNSPPSYQQAVLQIHAPRSPKDKLLTVKELRQLHDQASVRSTGNDITQNTSAVRGSLPQSVFFGQGSAGSDITQQNTSAVRGSLPQAGSPSLTLQRQTSLSLISAVGEGSRRTSIASRRASDPSVSPTSTSHLERLPRQTLAHGTKALVGQSLQDCGVKGSCAEPHHNSMGLEPGPRFCLSTSASLAVRDYFSRTHIDPDSCLRMSQEVSVAIIQGRREWQSRRCSDPSFDDFDQMFFAEESYV
ncbi:hypothetical protein SKAU_G00153540 [Synaphobranchus kaupii]|uniref:Rho-GAP domain-containing protein n=1 Tax=Synaphobranchus kaupii TaxID=118154 RepID=A0A9Q1IWX4_SYNKA|nr:hypothetical protein SKAU_G00153540 [Synaphobranchus kaupii]